MTKITLSFLSWSQGFEPGRQQTLAGLRSLRSLRPLPQSPSSRVSRVRTRCFRTQPKEFIAICVPWHSVAVGRLPLRGVSTPGHGQGEGPVDSKLSRSDDADGDGRGRSERSERSHLRGNLPTAAKHGAQKRILTFRKVFDIFVIYNKPRANNN